MAITWGPIAGNNNGSKAFRVGYEFGPIPAVGQDTASVNITVKIYLWTKVRVTESSGKLSISGTLGSQNLTGQKFNTTSTHHWDKKNQILIHTKSGNVNTKPGATVPVSVTASVSNISYMGNSLKGSVTGSATIPARPLYAPPGPTSIAAQREHDKRYKIIVKHAAAGASNPIQHTIIYRSDNGADWKQVAQLSGAATSWSDTGTAPNGAYKWRARTRNSGGTSSGYADTALAYTTPPTPHSVSGSKTASGDIVVRWDRNGARYADRYIIEDSPNGGTWVQVAQSTATNWTHQNPDTAKTHRYRVTAVTPSGLRSGASSPSSTVQLQAPPNPPTNLVGPMFDPSEPWTVTWQHNPVDTTSQTQYRLRWRTSPGQWSTGPIISSATSEHVFAAGIFAQSGDTPVEWQVQTRGAAPGWSGWSAMQTSIRSVRPTMGIIAPTGILRSGTVRTEWTYYDQEGTAQTGWRVRMLVDGQMVGARQGSDAATSTTFTAHAPDGSQVTVEGEVRDGAGMWSLTAASDTVPVEYELPGDPTMEVEYDPETGTASVTITTSTEGAETAYHRLLADDGDGGWRIVADDIPPDGSAVDTTPVLGVETHYQLETVATNTAVAAIETTTRFDARRRWWVTLADGSSTWYVTGDPSISIAGGRDRETVPYEGRSWPVSHVGTMQSQNLTFSATLSEGLNSPQREIEASALAAVPWCFRTPDGRRLWVSPGALTTPATSERMSGMSVPMSRIGSLDVTP